MSGLLDLLVVIEVKDDENRIRTFIVQKINKRNLFWS